MPQRTDIFDLGRLGLTLRARAAGSTCTSRSTPFDYGGERYAADAGARARAARRLAHDRQRLRAAAALQRRARRARACAASSPAAPAFEVDAREVHQPGGGDELQLALRRRRRRARPRARGRATRSRSRCPARSPAGPDCAGLCPQCGANLNEEPDHAHEAEPDPRWAKLSELRVRVGARRELRYPSRRHGRPQAEAVARAHDQAPRRSTRSPRRR